MISQTIYYSSPTSAGAECIDPGCNWVEQWYTFDFIIQIWNVVSYYAYACEGDSNIGMLRTVVCYFIRTWEVWYLYGQRMYFFCRKEHLLLKQKCFLTNLFLVMECTRKFGTSRIQFPFLPIISMIKSLSM